MKYYQPYKTVCCFTAPYDGNVDSALTLYADFDFSTDDDVATKYIFDRDYVSENLVGGDCDAAADNDEFIISDDDDDDDDDDVDDDDRELVCIVDYAYLHVQ